MVECWNASNTVSRHPDDCIKRCSRNDSCNGNISKCYDLCNNCSYSKDGPGCYWEKFNLEKTRQGIYMNDDEERDILPNPPIITLTKISNSGTKAFIKWYHNNIDSCFDTTQCKKKKCTGPAGPKGGVNCDYFKTNHNLRDNIKVKEYIGVLQEQFKINHGIKIFKIKTNYCSDYCEYVINNLIPNENYIFSIYTKNNNNKFSKESNKIIFTTTPSSVYNIYNINLYKSNKQPIELEDLEYCS